MGTWGPDIFDNDKAADWVFDVAKSTDMSLVEATVGKVVTASDEYLNANIAIEALAAIEVVARLKGKWGIKCAHSEAADKWVEENKFDVSSDLIDSCKNAIDRIMGNNSELIDNWQNNAEYYEQWKQGVADLKKRISS